MPQSVCILVTGGAGDESVGGSAAEAAHPAEADQEAGQAAPDTESERPEASCKAPR